MPHVSVVTPTYNRAHLVGRTIESLVAQRFQDWDLLVVDDASRDETVDVVQRYCQRDSRIRLVVNEQNVGLTRNWNRCLEMAAGPLVELLQSDDLIDSDYLELVSEFYDEHPQVGFVAASCRYIDADGQITHPGSPRPPRLYCAGDEAVTALLTGGWPHVSSIVMRRECYERLGTFNQEIWHGPDGEMFTRLASQYDVYHFGEVHTSFRRHGTNMGVLEYLRDDFLQTDMYKKRLTWRYLSSEGRRLLGVEDLNAYLAKDAAQTALAGVPLMVAYGRHDLGRSYFRRALKIDSQCWHSPQFWKAWSLLLVPGVSGRIMRSRLGVGDEDRRIAKTVESSLRMLGNADE
jgi:glycosyltransferase involved in cell wall biosynthesis